MKKISFLIQFLFVVSVVLHGQNAPIELTFSAVYQGEAVQLDSIFIQNLTQGGDTMLHAPNTSLLLDVTTGFEEGLSLNKNFQISQNIPNPFADKTAFTVFVPEKGWAEIVVRNTLGQNLAFHAGLLEAGTHRFDFFAGSDQFYLLAVSLNGETRSLKMISNGRIHAGNCRLHYTGSETAEPMFKSGNNSGGLIFCWGDLLRFTGYATTPLTIGNNEIEDSPSGNQSYTFNILEGIRCPGMSTLTDIDGNVYNTVLMGNQCWMKENLKTTTYKNGTAIPNVTAAGDWMSLITGAYVWYDNDIGWKDKYGALYNWYAAIDSNELCPAGWHVPTHDDWTGLTGYIGGTTSPNGKKLKLCRQVNSPLGGDCNTTEHPRWNQFSMYRGTDDYGFSGHPGGGRSSAQFNAEFDGIGKRARWWTSTEYSSSNARYRILFYELGSIGVQVNSKNGGYSVRCLRDDLAAHVADFSATPTSGTAPLTVNFYDQSINTPTSWLWNFGDGNTSTQKNPVHTYQITGIFTVQLTATNGAGSNTKINTDFITVISGSFLCGSSTISDIDGNVYTSRATLHVCAKQPVSLLLPPAPRFPPQPSQISSYSEVMT